MNTIISEKKAPFKSPYLVEAIIELTLLSILAVFIITQVIIS